MRAEERMDELVEALRTGKAIEGDLSAEEAELLAVALRVRSRRLYRAAPDRGPWLPISALAVAAGVLLFVLLAPGLGRTNVVLAMEEAVIRLQSYHGVLELRRIDGPDGSPRRAEIWIEGIQYAYKGSDTTLKVNNAERRWSVHPNSQTVYVGLPVPDLDRDQYHLLGMARRAKRYPTEVVQVEEIVGRKATKLKVTPPGGDPEFLWVDQATNLPIRYQKGVLQWTFTSFEPNVAIDPSVFTYTVPPGYRVVQSHAKLVADLNEARTLSGIVPYSPRSPPSTSWPFPVGSP